jgi:hypothetical protein
MQSARSNGLSNPIGAAAMLSRGHDHVATSVANDLRYRLGICRHPNELSPGALRELKRIEDHGFAENLAKRLSGEPHSLHASGDHNAKAQRFIASHGSSSPKERLSVGLALHG